ncbi:tRNA lysidine(34) synthetase TilS [Amaricoccus sp.]|uniref:tRNA lysidine(34) synthetase TilS n=1 Tax=Amaricoccus sp. TaxID=1872485 RepID=UPI001B59FFC3|nr:tRNA lysidine(34) synthetase TilS [Amaricoccus sp.]MBP7003355.1 tRNA lysidine(34) synthetase TilS [Amaricoccus sp.]
MPAPVLTPPEALAGPVARAMAAAPAGAVGVAVSGGGDSVALLLLLRHWAAGAGRRVEVATVDHGLRPEAAEEAASVGRLCAGLGISHATLPWRGWEGRGNLQEAAREARRRLLGGWARERGLAAVALGHTLDDQAETFLLRLARGSGVDGLAAMAVAAQAGGVTWLRPMLGLRRAALRDWLAEAGVDWAEDPSNDDPAFDRVRARAALGPLAGLGLGPERLAATAARMARARAALEAATDALAAAAAAPGAAGDLVLDPARLAAAPEELRLRIVAAALVWVAGARVRPRLATTEAAAAAVLGQGLNHGMTAHGCVLRPWRGAVAVRREPARVGPPVLPGAVWDGRWEVRGAAADTVVGALGTAGLAARPGWRETGLAREALLTTPGIWRGDRLVAAPVLEPGGAATARRVAALPGPWADSR